MYFTIQFSSILSDSLRINHFDLQKLSLITLNYWGYTFPLHSGSDSYCKCNCRVLRERVVFLLFKVQGFQLLGRNFSFLLKKENLLLNKLFMTDAITSKFKLRILVMAGETSKILSTTYPMHGLQITQLSF